jgi:hypothetical protein
MSAPAGFEPVTEVTADERSRITVSKAGVRSNDRFLVSTKPTGEILLTPLASIPKRELIVWENDQLRESLLRGLAQAAAGQAEPIDQDWLNTAAEDDEDSE